jgi:hypothetical protein
MRLAQEARRVVAQHQFLDALESSTLLTLERGGVAEMNEALASFENALVAHFAIEERVQFPALHGLDSRFAPELSDLVRAHERFRAEIAALRAQVQANGGRPVLLSGFGRLAAELRLHEEREEKLLAEAARLD